MPAGATALSNVPPGIAIAAGLQGALLLARARPYGLLLFESSPTGVARTFIAMAICLPAYLALRLSSLPDGPIAMGPLRLLAGESLGFAVAWLGFALASFHLAQRLGQEQHWPRFLAAWNWSNVVQYAAMLAATLVPSALGATPLLVQAIAIIGLGYAVWLEWYVIRVALSISGLVAVGFVLLDMAIALAVSAVTTHFTGL